MLKPIRILPAMLLPAPTVVFASTTGNAIDLTASFTGIFALAVFVLAYLFVMSEEYTDLRKSKPVILAAGVIWAAIAAVYAGTEYAHLPEDYARESLLEYAELALFLLVAMTYVNTMEERRIFEVLQAWMVRRGFSLRQVFWLTGGLAFVISPIADNLTTALLMCAVVLTVGRSNKRFVSIGCVNIVVAANAGGAFSPFGDITTLMVWQKGFVHFWDFFRLFIPSLVNWLLPAAVMSILIGREQPLAIEGQVLLKRGARRVVLLFLATIATAVVFHNYLNLPPVLGMFTGLAYLQFFGFYLKKTYDHDYLMKKYGMDREEIRHNETLGNMVPFDVFNRVSRAEWDTLLFFFGVVMCVGALGFIGYLAMASELLYQTLGATTANISIGALSAIIDNIPVMYAVLTMNPDMSLGQWLLVTLTAGVGGSLLSIGSAAGVALMGQARGIYTFSSHLRWTPVIALGYAAGIGVHMLLNRAIF